MARFSIEEQVAEHTQRIEELRRLFKDAKEELDARISAIEKRTRATRIKQEEEPVTQRLAGDDAGRAARLEKENAKLLKEIGRLRALVPAAKRPAPAADTDGGRRTKKQATDVETIDLIDKPDGKHETVQHLREAGINVSPLGNANDIGSLALDFHLVTRREDFTGKTRESFHKVAKMLTRKAMRLQDLPNRPYDLTDQDWKHLRSRPKRMPAQTPLDPGLHVARTKGDKAYFYWIVPEPGEPELREPSPAPVAVAVAVAGQVCAGCHEGPGDEDLLSCAACSKEYHMGCLDPPLAADPKGERVCSDCQPCMVCKKNDNEDLTMLCDGCNVACHIYCLDPKLDAVPQDAWYCAKCTEDRDDAFLTDSEFDLSR